MFTRLVSTKQIVVEVLSPHLLNCLDKVTTDKMLSHLRTGLQRTSETVPSRVQKDHMLPRSLHIHVIKLYW